MTRLPLLVVLAILLLANCAPTREVLVPVATPCVPSDLPPQPHYPDSDDALLGAVDSAERYRLVLLGREVRISRLGLLEGVTAACQESDQ